MTIAHQENLCLRLEEYSYSHVEIQHSRTYILCMNTEAVRKLLRAECKSFGDESAFARKAGVTPALISAILTDKRPPRGKVLDALGLEMHIVYRKRNGTAS